MGKWGAPKSAVKAATRSQNMVLVRMRCGCLRGLKILCGLCAGRGGEEGCGGAGVRGCGGGGERGGG